MAKSNNLFSSEFVKAIKTALNDKIEKGDFDTCVSAESVATHKAVAKAFVVKNTSRLKLMVMTAVFAGQIAGFDSRKGRDGGIHRVKVKPVNKKKPVLDTVEAPVNDVNEESLMTVNK
jgi:hypothetical protein